MEEAEASRLVGLGSGKRVVALRGFIERGGQGADSRSVEGKRFAKGERNASGNADDEGYSNGYVRDGKGLFLGADCARAAEAAHSSAQTEVEYALFAMRCCGVHHRLRERFERGFKVLLRRVRYELAITDVSEGIGAFYCFSEASTGGFEGASGEPFRPRDASPAVVGMARRAVEASVVHGELGSTIHPCEGRRRACTTSCLQGDVGVCYGRLPVSGLGRVLGEENCVDICTKPLIREVLERRGSGPGLRGPDVESYRRLADLGQADFAAHDCVGGGSCGSPQRQQSVSMLVTPQNTVRVGLWRSRDRWGDLVEKAERTHEEIVEGLGRQVLNCVASGCRSGRVPMPARGRLGNEATDHVHDRACYLQACRRCRGRKIQGPRAVRRRVDIGAMSDKPHE